MKICNTVWDFIDILKASLPNSFFRASPGEFMDMEYTKHSLEERFIYWEYYINLLDKNQPEYPRIEEIYIQVKNELENKYQGA